MLDKVFKDFIEVLQTSKKELDETNLKDALNKAFSLLTLSFGFTLFLIVVLIFKNNHIGNFKEFKDFISFQDGATIAIFITIVVFIGIVIYFFINLPQRINKIKLINQKITEESILTSKFINLEGVLKLNFNHSFKYFQSLIKNYNTNTTANADATTIKSQPYIEFVNDFSKITDIKPEYLTKIADNANSSILGRFLCVISFNEYLKNNEDEINEMVNYFATFKKASTSNNIKRIFTIPGKGLNHEDLKTDFNETDYSSNISNEILLEYLITNKCCSIDTYLLTYANNNNEQIKEKFFTLADYVIASPLGNKDIGYNNELYFAFSPDTNGKNRILSTTDTYLIKLMEDDFAFRMNMEGKTGKPYTMISFKRGANFEKVLKMLHFEKDKKIDKVRVNAVIEKLSNRLNSSDKELSKAVKTWKL